MAVVSMCRRWSRYIVHLAVIVIASCGNTSTMEFLSTDSLRNAVYDLPDVGRISLREGVFDDSLAHPPVRIGFVDLFAFGDLDGDGSEDAVTFLSKRFGGPSLYLSLEAFLNRNGSPSHAASYLIGDRVGIDSVEIVQGTIRLHVITQAPTDSMCCPTLHVNKTLRLDHGQLIEFDDRL